MLKQIALIILAVSGWILPEVSAAPVQNWMERGNAFYAQGNYDSAVVYYEKIVQTGMSNSAVFYNLGNSYYRQKELGLAILYYEKAQRLAPNDPDIAANLTFAKAHLADRLPETEKGFFDTILWRIHTMLSLATQLWLVFLGLLIMSVLFAVALFASHNGRLWAIYGGSILAALLLVEGVSAGYKIYKAENTTYAVVLSEIVDVVSEPGGTKVLFTVHEGAKFRIRKKLDQWSLVSLPNGVSGWVENASLGII